MSRQVSSYFERTAAEFDAIHDRRSGWGALVDRLFRSGMRERQAYVLARAAVVQPPFTTLLDVGCGGGKYCTALAERGLAAVGVDFAPAMVELAAHRAAATGVAGRCRFLAGDVMTLSLAPTDLVLAIGVFDYVAKPGPLLARLRELTGRELIASFPRAGTWQGLLRRAWLLTKRCPVYYYTPADITQLTAGWPGSVDLVHSIRGDYLLHWRKP